MEPQLHDIMAKNKYRLHVGVVSTTIKDINLLADVSHTKAMRFMPEAEWLRKDYDKCSAQI